jgi:hypothetical protein
LNSKFLPALGEYISILWTLQMSSVHSPYLTTLLNMNLSKKVTSFRIFGEYTRRLHLITEGGHMNSESFLELLWGHFSEKCTGIEQDPNLDVLFCSWLTKYIFFLKLFANHAEWVSNLNYILRKLRVWILEGGGGGLLTKCWGETSHEFVPLYYIDFFHFSFHISVFFRTGVGCNLISILKYIIWSITSILTRFNCKLIEDETSIYLDSSYSWSRQSSRMSCVPILRGQCQHLLSFMLGSII